MRCTLCYFETLQSNCGLKGRTVYVTWRLPKRSAWSAGAEALAKNGKNPQRFVLPRPFKWWRLLEGAVWCANRWTKQKYSEKKYPTESEMKAPKSKRKPRGIERKQVVSITTDAFPARTSIVLEDDNNITLWLFHSSIPFSYYFLRLTFFYVTVFFFSLTLVALELREELNVTWNAWITFRQKWSKLNAFFFFF